MSINEKKTKIMILGTDRQIKKIRGNPNIELNGHPLARVPSYKYLGITLDEQLTLTSHVAMIIGSVANEINTLAYLPRYVGKKTALTIYRTIILPMMEYGNAIHALYNSYRKCRGYRTGS